MESDDNPTRHDAIHVMAQAMEKMAKRSDKLAAENALLRQRVEELTDLIANTSPRPAQGDVDQ